jgi:hypothetical protein
MRSRRISICEVPPGVHRCAQLVNSYKVVARLRGIPGRHPGQHWLHVRQLGAGWAASERENAQTAETQIARSSYMPGAAHRAREQTLGRGLFRGSGSH